jgi:hypothetical protein
MALRLVQPVLSLLLTQSYKTTRCQHASFIRIVCSSTFSYLYALPRSGSPSNAHGTGFTTSGHNAHSTLAIRTECFRVNRNGVVGAVCWNSRWMVVRLPVGARHFPLFWNPQTRSATHSASSPIGNDVSSPSGKAARTWGWPLTSTWRRG